MTWLHRLAILLAASTLVLVLLGALVTSTGAGLSVASWPSPFPATAETGARAGIQQAHRLVAAFVGFLALTVAVLAWRVDDRAWMKGLVLGMLGAGTAQAVYGGIAVINLLPAFISVFHAGLAQIFLLLTIAIAVFTSPAWLARGTAERGGAGAEAGDRALRRWAIAATATIYAQVLIGAAMRHSYTADGRPAGLAIPDYPLAFGRLLPISELVSWATALAFLHRLTALATAVVVGFTAARVFRRHISEDELVRPAALLMLLLVAQIALGGLTVLSGGHPMVSTTHAGVVAIALAASLVLALRAAPTTGPGRVVEAQAASQQGRTE
jgi:cytochrome c oxidase assembly protein subunit 15